MSAGTFESSIIRENLAFVMIVLNTKKEESTTQFTLNNSEMCLPDTALVTTSIQDIKQKNKIK